MVEGAVLGPGLASGSMGAAAAGAGGSGSRGFDGALATAVDDSTREQRGAGLIDLDAAEKATIARLNAGYRAKHGFPFIIAVRNYTRAQIFSEFARRLDNDPEAEIAACLEQVFNITRLRLDAMIAD